MLSNTRGIFAYISTLIVLASPVARFRLGNYRDPLVCIVYIRWLDFYAWAVFPLLPKYEPCPATRREFPPLRLLSRIRSISFSYFLSLSGTPEMNDPESSKLYRVLLACLLILSGSLRA